MLIWPIPHEIVICWLGFLEDVSLKWNYIMHIIMKSTDSAKGLLNFYEIDVLMGLVTIYTDTASA